MCEAFYESIEMLQADLDIESHPLIEKTVNNKLLVLAAGLGFSHYLIRITSYASWTLIGLQNAAHLMDVALFRQLPHWARYGIYNDNNWLITPLVAGSMNVSSFQKPVIDGKTIDTCVPRLAALLTMKLPGRSGGLTVSSAQTSLLDVATTIMKASGVDGRFPGRPIQEKIGPIDAFPQPASFAGLPVRDGDSIRKKRRKHRSWELQIPDFIALLRADLMYVRVALRTYKVCSSPRRMSSPFTVVFSPFDTAFFPFV